MEERERDEILARCTRWVPAWSARRRSGRDVSRAGRARRRRAGTSTAAARASSGSRRGWPSSLGKEAAAIFPQRHDGAADRAADLVRAQRLADGRIPPAVPRRCGRGARRTRTCTGCKRRSVGDRDRLISLDDLDEVARAARRAAARASAAQPRRSAAHVARSRRADEVGAERRASRCTSTARGSGSAGRSTAGR